MLKILHISGARSWGGNEQQLIDLIFELNKQSVENCVFGVENTPLAKECKKQNVRFIPAKKNKLSKFGNYKYLKKITNDLKPNVIHLHTSDSLTTFVLSDLLYKIKIPTVFSKKGMGRSSSFLSKFKYNYKNISAIICVSERVKKEFSEILSEKNRNKLCVIYDGISISRIKTAEKNINDILKIEDTEHKLINIANHVRAKDLPTLVKMMNELVNNLGQKNVQLIQIGEFKAEITDELVKMTKEFSLENQIKLIGFFEDASSYLSQFDLFVMSSEREGFPLTIYEAFYKKIPVVSTKAGGIPEIIIDNENGFLTNIGDFKNLALKIKELLNDKNKQISFTEINYNLFISNYSSEKCALKTMNLYKTL